MRALLLIPALLLGCGDDPVPAEAGPPSGPTRTVLAPDGSSIVVPEVVDNVYATNAAALDVLLALDVPDRIRALPATAFEYSSLADDPTGYEDRLRFANIDTEDILALEPDLVLVHDWQAPTQGKWLRENGIPMLVLPSVTSWDDVETSVRSVAEAIGEPARGHAVLADLQERREALATRAARLPARRAMSYGNYGGSGSTAGRGTTWHLMFELAGLENAAGDREHAYPIDIERILILDPDLFVVSENREGVTPAIEALRAHEATAELRAVRDDQVVSLPASLYSTSSVRILAAAEELVTRLEALSD